MPIKAILQTVDGTSRIGIVVDADGGLNRCLPFGDPDVVADHRTLQSFQLLQRVDPYCDIVFKPSQMPQLLGELELLMNRASNQSCQALLARVHDLAIQCRDSHQVLLRFLGD
jgi:hypothetical protein